MAIAIAVVVGLGATVIDGELNLSIARASSRTRIMMWIGFAIDCAFPVVKNQLGIRTSHCGTCR
jgi:hypothetical protein